MEADRPGDPAEETCGDGLLIAVNQRLYVPSFGVMATGQVWFHDGQTLSLASPDLRDVVLLAEDPYEPSVSPEADRIAFRRDGELVLHEVATGDEISVAAPFTHAHGFVATESGRSRAYTCADGVLTVLGAERATVARDVSNCHGLFVATDGPVLGWLDGAERFRWLYGDAVEPLMLVPRLSGSLRPGSVVINGRFLLHQPALPCEDGGDACGYVGADFAQLYDARGGDFIADIPLGAAGVRLSTLDGPDTLAVHAGSGLLTLIGPDASVRAFAGYRPLAGLVGGVIARREDDGLFALMQDGAMVELAPPGVGAEARIDRSPDGTGFALAHPTGRCLREEGGECRLREQRVAIGAASAPAAMREWIGWGHAQLRAATDAGAALVTGFADEDGAGDGHGEYRVIDILGRTLVEGSGEVSAVHVEGSELYFVVYGGGLHGVNGAGSAFATHVEPVDLVVDRRRSRLLRLRAFPHEEEEISDLGPPTDFCVFETPIPGSGS
jgi:hypothetical protein